MTNKQGNLFSKDKTRTRVARHRQRKKLGTKGAGHFKIEIKDDGTVESVEPSEHEVILYNAHEAEAKAKGAEFYNEGWVQEEYAVCSKTSKGYLDSQIDPETYKVTHLWDPYD